MNFVIYLFQTVAKIYWLNFLIRIYRTVLISCCLAIMPLIPNAIAQTVNPLKIDRSDVLVPKGYGKRELSSFEKYRIQREIEKLKQSAQNEFKQGNTNLAVTQWYRQLRLTRIIDQKLEIDTLGKIGAIFWQENRREDLRNIANRLVEIQTTDQSLSFEMLNDLARAYESIKYLDKAIEIYQKVLAESKIEQRNIINKLGELYLDIFDYDNATIIYQNKLEQDNDKAKQEAILKTLVEIFDKSDKIKQSITTRQQLIAYYAENNKDNKIPALELENGNRYKALNQVDKAIEAYEKALALALETQQFSIAEDALINLKELN